MAAKLIVNPIDRTKLIDTGSTLEVLTPTYGRIDNSGLFDKEGIASRHHLFEVEPEGQTAMTGLGSMTERERWKLTHGRNEQYTLGSVYFGITDAVQYDDIANIITDWKNFDEDKLVDIIAKKQKSLYDVAAANKEYMALTAATGVMRDPLDGAPAVDMFEITGKVKTTFAIDLTAPTGLLAKFTELQNLLIEKNVVGGNISSVEIIVAENVFAKLSQHPELVAFYEAALYGTGLAYVNNPIINGRVNEKTRNTFGLSQSFNVMGFTISTYPQKFTRWDRTSVSAVADSKGMVVISGIGDLYQAKWTPAPYLSNLGKTGQELYGWRTPVVDDTHLELYLEFNGVYFMKQPELAVEITFTV